MGAITGISTCCDDPAPRRELLAAMGRALVGEATEGVQVVENDQVAMAFHPLWPSGQALGQVLRIGDGLSIAWDGRLDNRDTLLSQLGGDAQTSDAELVIAAYRRWDDDFATRLVGDFAFGLHDGDRRRLLLARDPFAGRPLFFSERPEGVLWASTVGALAASGRVPLDVDDHWVGAYLIGAQGGARTPFPAVDVVAPGEVVTITPEGTARHRFWRPDLERSIRFTRDEDYEEAFRELFIASVRHRLRTKAPVLAELSGGLDSSSNVCVAHRLIEAGEVEASELHTQSWVYDHASAADERPFIEVVEGHVGKSSIHLLEDEHPVLTGFEKARPLMPHPWQNWPLGRRCTAETMRRLGARLLLSGHGGDHLLWSEIDNPPHLADHVVEGRPRELWRALGAWHRETGQPLPGLVWEGVLKPLWQASRGHSNAHELSFDFAWLTPERRRGMARHFAENLDRRRRFGPIDRLPSRLLRAETIHWAVNTRSWMLDDLDLGFQSAYPFLDRPLVEFCLAIPFEQHARPTEMRSLHRRALRGILPEIVRVRTCKRGPSDATMHAFRREWPVIQALFEGEDARLYRRGHVDRRAFLAELERIRHGVYGDHAIVVRALQVEVWLRHVEGLALPPTLRRAA